MSWSLYFCLCLFTVFADASKTQKECSLVPTESGLSYRESVQGYGTIVRDCPPGAVFSVETCTCSKFTHTVTSTSGFDDGIETNIPVQSAIDQFSIPDQNVRSQQTDIGYSPAPDGKDPISVTMAGGEEEEEEVGEEEEEGDVNKIQVPNTPTQEEQNHGVDEMSNTPDPIKQQNEPQKECSLVPTESGLSYREFVEGYGTIVRDCPPGAVFSVETCTCSKFAHRVTSTSGSDDGIQANSPATDGKDPIGIKMAGVKEMLNAPDSINPQNEPQKGDSDWRQKLSQETNPSLESLLSILLLEYINKQKVQREDLTARAQPALFQKQNAVAETQAPKTKKVALKLSFNAEIRDPTKAETENNGPLESQTTPSSDFQSGPARNDQLPLGPFEKILLPVAYEDAVESVQEELALDSALGVEPINPATGNPNVHDPLHRR